MQKSKKILLPILIVISILIAVFIGINITSHNNVEAAPSSVDVRYISWDGSTQSTHPLISNPLVYCISYGLDFAHNTYYARSDESYVDFETAYYVANQSVPAGTPRKVMANIINRMIWYKYDRYRFVNNVSTNPHETIPTFPYSQETRLMEDAQIYSMISDWTVSIDAPELSASNPYIDTNSEGKYGPFVIKYPEYNGKPFAIVENYVTEMNDNSNNMKAKYARYENAGWTDDAIYLLINGTTRISSSDSRFPRSGANFYLGEADGIVPGQENTIQLVYQGKVLNWSGITISTYTPATNVWHDVRCPECGGWGTIQKAGYLINGSFYTMYDGNLDDSWDSGYRWIDMSHEDACSNAVGNYYSHILWGSPYKAPGYDAEGIWHGDGEFRQDFIELSGMPTFRPLPSPSIKFWPGKPDVRLNFEKKDLRTDELIGNANFRVEVENATIADGGTISADKRSSTFTTDEINSTNFRFRPVPGVTSFKVKFIETSAPNKYILLADPVEITYNWNGTNWVASYDNELNTGKEQVEVIDGISWRQTNNCTDTFEVTVENRRRVELTLNKVGPDGTSLDGAVFEVSITNGTLAFKDGRTGNTFVTGSGDNTILVSPEAGQTSFTVRYTEISTPNEQYIKLQEPIEIEYRLQTNGSWKPTQTSLDLLTGNEHIVINAIGTEDYQFQVVAENRKKVEVDFEKYGQDGTHNLVGAKFNVKLSNAVLDDGTDEYTFTTAEDSSANKIIVSPLNKNNFTITYTEIEAPYKYIALRRPFTITYSWDATNSKWTPSYNGTLDVGEILNVENENGDSYKFISAVENRRKVEVRLDKTDPEWNSISGAKFTVSVENGTYEFVNTSLTNPFEANPSIDNTILVEPNAGVTSFKVIYHEEAPAPKGFALLKDDVVIEYRTIDGGKTWSPVSANTTLATGGERIKTNQDGDRFTYKIQAENRRKIIIDLLKIDTENTPLANISFDLTVANGTFEDTEGITNGSTSGTITTKADGKMHIEIIPNGKNRVTLTLKEHEDRFIADLENVVIEFEYIEATGDWVSSVKQPSPIKQVPNSGKKQVSITGKTEFYLEIVNIFRIVDFELEKVNTLDTDEKIEGITFKVEIENGRSVNYGTVFTRTTDSNGKLNIGEIQIDRPSQPTRIKLTETGKPSNLEGKVNFLDFGRTCTFEYQHNHATNETTIGGNEYEFPGSTALLEVHNNKISVKFANRVAIDLSGMVWEDVQHGVKPPLPPNGYRQDDESGMAGIIVKLFNADGTPAKGFDGKEIAQQITGADGSYIFKDLPASINGNIKYYIAFSYDGVNYIASEKHATGSTPETDSDVDELNRTAFNNRFKTITKGQSNDGTTLEYDYSADPILITKNSNGTVLDKFAMTAEADNDGANYGYNTQYIDMGLEKKEVDLAAVTELENAIVAINGKVQEYQYSDLTSGELDLDKLQGDNVNYNLYLYDSDYNYRIGDYKLEAAQSETLTVNENPSYMESLMAQRREDGELAVYLAYQIAVSNRSNKPSTVNYLSYYYDLNYEPIALIKLNRDGTEEMIYNFQELIASNPSLTPTRVDMDGDGTPDKYLMKFAINQPVNEYINENYEIVFNVKLAELNLNNGAAECNNWVEIVSYSTDEGGLVDMNSAPDNILDGVDRRKENDTDDATKLTIQLNGLNREISGYVFEDYKETEEPGQYNTGNGLYDGIEPKIDDVIVQLIEIKDVTVLSNTYRLEYIWQETTTGSNKVTYVTSDGRSKGEYTLDNRVNGEYKFNRNIIPGNYIVRFIYGDGTYWDTAINTQNLTRYNGQDYKSATSFYYNKAEFSQYDYASNETMAFDNEARRLEEMAYATKVTDPNDLIIASGDRNKLNKTWMCADTALINMEISVDPYSINFGLIKRPQMTLEIEKHITGLKINAGNGEVIAEASTDMSKYAEDGIDVELNMNSGGVAATKTSKTDNNRGSWTVQTQTSKLQRGTIDITYTYSIRNVGDLDYIGLASNQNYSTLARQVKTSQSDVNSGYVIGTYLGSVYYSGDTNNTSGNSKVDLAVQVEDYLGAGLNKLTLFGGDFKTVETAEKQVWNISGDPAQEKDVEVIRTDRTYNIGDTITQTVTNQTLNTTGVNKDVQFRSYAAQLISADGNNINKNTGTLIKGLKASVPDTTKVQSYAPTSTIALNTADAIEIQGDANYVFAADPSEFVAETVIITLDTGGTDPETKSVESNTLRIAEIVAGSMAIIAVGLVLIKKFAIKKYQS